MKAAKPTAQGGARYHRDRFNKAVASSGAKAGNLCQIDEFGYKYTAVYVGKNNKDEHTFYIAGKLTVVTGLTQKFDGLL